MKGGDEIGQGQDEEEKGRMKQGELFDLPLPEQAQGPWFDDLCACSHRRFVHALDDVTTDRTGPCRRCLCQFFQDLR